MKMYTYSRSVILFFISIIILSGLFFGILYKYDPLHMFDLESWSEKIKFARCLENDIDNCESKVFLHDDTRLQWYWLINNLEFDSVILWSSILQNTSAKLTSTSLWWNFINLSVAWSTQYERNIILDYVTTKKDIKKVIFSIDGLSNHTNFTKRYPYKSWSMLYDNNKFNDILVYLNKKYLKCLIIFSNSQECIWSVRSLDSPTNRFDDHWDHFWWVGNWSLQMLNKLIIQKVNNKPNKDKIYKPWWSKSEKELRLVREYIDTTLINKFKEYPNIEFYLIEPPFSIIHTAFQAQKDTLDFEIKKDALQYITEQTEWLSNVTIYGFGNDNFVDDIANYRDLIHIHPDYNAIIIEKIENQENLINNDNIQEYIDGISSKATEYNLKWIFRQALKIRDRLK